MSEEERIISSIKPIVNARKTHKDNNLYSLQLNTYQLDMIQSLLDLYNKEREKNKKIFIQYEKRVNELEREIAINSISKDKIREVLDITATVLGDKYELDYQDIQDVIAETITKIRQELLD